MLTVITAFAEMERHYIFERTRSALATKEAQGERLGNPSFGVFAWEEAVRATARELRTQGLSLRAIALALETRRFHPRRAKTWSPEMVRRLMVEAA